MIKIKLRRNLLYLLAYYISWYARKILSIIINAIFSIDISYISLYLMTFGEIIGGSALYIYIKYSLKEKKRIKYFDTQLIYNEKEVYIPDTISKIILLIFFAATFDFLDFIGGNFFIPALDKNISPTIDLRLFSIQTVVSALLCTYALKFKMSKHHKISLIAISLCEILILILEVIFKNDKIPFKYFLLSRFLLCLYTTGECFNNCIERYLVDTNFINTFFILMLEGIFEFIAGLFISINEHPFKGIIKQYEENDISQFFLLLFLLLLYLLLSVMVNAYKIYCNVIYSPMARSLIDYLMNPFLNIYYFISDNDFGGNYIYFFISELICLIMDFFGCIYNEYIILYFCGLEHDTKDQISYRAETCESKRILDPVNLGNIEFNDDDDSFSSE